VEAFADEPVVRPFALRRISDPGVDTIVAYGLALPDGSVVVVDWPRTSGHSVSFLSGVEPAAERWLADWVWLDDRPDLRGLRVAPHSNIAGL
jgi:hypothetical protein